MESWRGLKPYLRSWAPRSHQGSTQSSTSAPDWTRARTGWTSPRPSVGSRSTIRNVVARKAAHLRKEGPGCSVEFGLDLADRGARRKLLDKIGASSKGRWHWPRGSSYTWARRPRSPRGGPSRHATGRAVGDRVPFTSVAPLAWEASATLREAHSLLRHRLERIHQRAGLARRPDPLPRRRVGTSTPAGPALVSG